VFLVPKTEWNPDKKRRRHWEPYYSVKKSYSKKATTETPPPKRPWSQDAQRANRRTGKKIEKWNMNAPLPRGGRLGGKNCAEKTDTGRTQGMRNLYAEGGGLRRGQGQSKGLSGFRGAVPQKRAEDARTDKKGKRKQRIPEQRGNPHQDNLGTRGDARTNLGGNRQRTPPEPAGAGSGGKWGTHKRFCKGRETVGRNRVRRNSKTRCKKP